MHKYLRKVAHQYDVNRYIKLNHVFRGARWLDDLGKWEVTILRVQDNHVCGPRHSLLCPIEDE